MEASKHRLTNQDARSSWSDLKWNQKNEDGKHSEYGLVFLPCKLSGENTTPWRQGNWWRFLGKLFCVQFYLKEPCIWLFQCPLHSCCRLKSPEPEVSWRERSCWNPGFSRRITVLACSPLQCPAMWQLVQKLPLCHLFTRADWPWKRELTFPIYPVLWGLELVGFFKITKQTKKKPHTKKKTNPTLKPQTKRESNPHQGKPVLGHSCTWLSNITMCPLILTGRFLGGEGGGRHSWGLVGCLEQSLRWATSVGSYTGCNWRKTSGLQELLLR